MIEENGHGPTSFGYVWMLNTVKLRWSTAQKNSPRRFQPYICMYIYIYTYVHIHISSLTSHQCITSSYMDRFVFTRESQERHSLGTPGGTWRRGDHLLEILYPPVSQRLKHGVWRKILCSLPPRPSSYLQLYIDIPQKNVWDTLW